MAQVEDDSPANRVKGLFSAPALFTARWSYGRGRGRRRRRTRRGAQRARRPERGNAVFLRYLLALDAEKKLYDGLGRGGVGGSIQIVTVYSALRWVPTSGTVLRLAASASTS